MNDAPSTIVASCGRTKGASGQHPIPASAETGRLLRTPGKNSALATLVSLPWCCILPAALSFLSLSGAVVTRMWVTQLTWVLLPLSMALLGRAFWLLYVNLQGGVWSRRLTWLAAGLIVAVWAPRLWARIA